METIPTMTTLPREAEGFKEHSLSYDHLPWTIHALYLLFVHLLQPTYY